MPFDPALPVINTLIDANELRAQFNGLKELIDAQQQQLDAQQVFINEILGRLDDVDTVLAGLQAQAPNWLTQSDMEPLAANNIDGVPELALTVSNPPTTSEVEQIVDKFNEAISGLHR
jgi:hypothetical protein